VEIGQTGQILTDAAAPVSFPRESDHGTLGVNAMNKKRRAKLQDIADKLDEIATDEREALDNMPESLQDSERGLNMADGADLIDEARDLLQQVIDQ
jgi:hypothetical protein